jgi:hypothetical protein
MKNLRSPIEYKEAIENSGKDIYTPIEIGDTDYWIPKSHLEVLLSNGLCGYSVSGLQLRTRSKVVKLLVCDALGYPRPKSFKRTQPRFVGQELDIYVQKSTNLQIWNEKISPSRRYAIIQVSESDIITKVKVVNGQELALLDTTGTITTKYQARLQLHGTQSELISARDTNPISSHINDDVFFLNISPTDEPESGQLLPIRQIYERLLLLIGSSFPDPGRDQERRRGEVLHRIICEHLGYRQYGENGQFPDIRNQLLEVKLQTSPTIDLGLVLPSSEEHLDIQPLGQHRPRHCDTRYAMFYAFTDGVTVTLTHLFVSTGEDFFTRFRRFEGKIKNGKKQIPLPSDFFGS